MRRARWWTSTSGPRCRRPTRRSAWRAPRTPGWARSSRNSSVSTSRRGRWHGAGCRASTRAAPSTPRARPSSSPSGSARASSASPGTSAPTRGARPRSPPPATPPSRTASPSDASWTSSRRRCARRSGPPRSAWPPPRRPRPGWRRRRRTSASAASSSTPAGRPATTCSTPRRCSPRSAPRARARSTRRTRGAPSCRSCSGSRSTTSSPTRGDHAEKARARRPRPGRGGGGVVGGAPRPHAPPLHRLRRGRGARHPQRGDGARAGGAVRRGRPGAGECRPRAARQRRHPDPPGGQTRGAGRRGGRHPPPAAAGRAQREHLEAGRGGAAGGAPAGGIGAGPRRAQLEARGGAGRHGCQHGAAPRRRPRAPRPGAQRAGSRPRSPPARGGGGGDDRRRPPPARGARAAPRAEAGGARPARGDGRQVRYPRARRPHHGADAVHLAGRAGAAGHRDRRGARSDRQVRAGLRSGRRGRPLPRRPACRDRARQRARPPLPGRGQLRRRPGELHTREDRDAERPHGPGLPRQGARAGERGAPPAGHGRQRVPSMIRLRALEKRYGSRRALAGIDLVLERREIVGVVGPDGAGKTTLLRALAGLLEVEAAEATVLGHDLRGDVTALKARVGYVPQAFSLHRDLTVEENLRFTARLHRVAEAEFRARAGELLARTGLAPFAGRPTGALSGGMKQKLAIASALLPRPALLLLDEPTAGVDVMSRADIWALLEREREAALVLIATSYLDEAGAADRLLYLERGRLIAAGTPAELRAAGPLQVYRAWGDARAIARRSEERRVGKECRSRWSPYH